MSRSITAILYLGILLTAYGALWGSSRMFFIGIAVAVAAWLFDACRRDVQEVSE